MPDVTIIGGGPSGLSAAYEIARHRATVTVFERLDIVGGLARTIRHDGNRYDIGPHRFFTKNAEVRTLYTDILAKDAVRVPRLTRILSNGRYFDYPLTPLNATLGVGLIDGAMILASYAAAQLRQALAPAAIITFEDWVVNRFGRRLYELFFKGYTEKVWGVPCSQIGADWAAQRIKGLSLASAARNALLKGNHAQIKSLVDEFIYPRLGAGQVYELMVLAIEEMNGEVRTGARVCRLRREANRVMAATVEDRQGRYDVESRFFLVSAPLTDLIEMIEPEPPPAIKAAARALRYRQHIGVNLLVDGQPFPDNWIYVHSRDVAFARIANYRNFSHAMAASERVSPLTVEYFDFPGGKFSAASDHAMVERAVSELTRLKLIAPDQAAGGFVVRSEKAYPLLALGYQGHIAIIKSWLDQFENLLPIGRGGMFKYNNQDHAIATGLVAARTALGLARLDPWRVNIEAEYHESGPALGDA